MRCSFRPDRFAAIALLAAGLAVVLSLASPTTRAQDAPAVELADPAADDADSFKIPEGDADAIQKFINQLAKREPEGETEQEQRAYTVKVLTTLAAAGESLLKANPTDRQAAEAYEFRITALSILNQLGEKDVEKKLAEAIDAARNDKRDPVAVVGWQSFIQNAFSNWETADDAAKQKFADAIVDKVKEDGVQPIDVSIVGAVATNLDGTDDEFVGKLLAAANPLIEKSDDATVKQTFDEANLAGMLRRMKLMGQPMEISGKTLDGKEIDWDSYRGKVVLVDFWASWCGPCRAELPNVLRLYKAYHDKGFDVLGISLDETQQAAVKGVKDANIPWPSIFPENEEERRWNHPLVRHYGIGGIPMAILVDQEGNVVHMQARGENLATELQRLLGDPLVPLDKDGAGEKNETETAVEK
jgi:thiol-disulfide isomerase/thioredoxin